MLANRNCSWRAIDEEDYGGIEEEESELNSIEKCCLMKLLKLDRSRRNDATFQKALAAKKRRNKPLARVKGRRRMNMIP